MRSKSHCADVQVELRRAFANFLFKVISIPIEKASRLAIILVAAPLLGPKNFGIYQFAVTVTSLVALSSEFGLGIWTTRALARDPKNAPAIVGTGLRLRSMTLPLYVVVTAAVVYFQGADGTRAALILLSATAFASSFLDYLGAIFRGHERLRDEASVSAVRAVLASAGGLGGLGLFRSVNGLAGGLMVGTLAGTALGLWTLRSAYSSFGARTFDRRLIRLAASEALPLWLAGLLSTLYFRFDVVILRAYSGDAEVGVYSAAYRLFEAGMIIPSVLLAVIFPKMVRAEADPHRQRRLKALLGISLTAGGALAALVFALSSGWLVRLAFGAAFSPAGPMLRILALALLPMFLNFMLTHLLIARGLERAYLVIVALMFVMNVGANLILIPSLGGRGAAWATLITETALMACCLVADGRQRKVRAALP